MTLPVAMTGSDVIGQAKTGTGKTLGFGLPILERVTVPADVEAGRATPDQLTDTPQALVVVPTRELCQQVTNDLLTAGKVRNVRVLAIYGGRSYEPQVEALRKGVDVIVGTPGRLLDLAGQKKLNLGDVRSLVLDEADEMLDLGFLPDVERILQLLPAKRQTMLFSATMPGAVISLARRYMTQPTHISATSPDDAGQTVANTKQHIFRAHNMDKPELVSRILQAQGRGLAMIFCRTKRTAADIADQLARRGFASGAVHGDLGQGAREQALRAFRNGKVDVLVCTDVAARGIDVDGVTHVINYQSPEDEKTYLHRIGRTGRAGKSGIAITLVDWDDIPRWKLINKALDLPFDNPEETYSTSAHLYELLGIPAGTTGTLPRSDRTRAGLRAEEVEDLGETGGRGRGPKDAGRDSGRSGGKDSGGRDAGRGAPVVAEAEEQERPKRDRTPRRRTRNGGTDGTDGAPAQSAVTAVDTAEASAPVETVPAAPTDSEDSAEPRQPRRRRRRGAAPRSEAGVETAEATAVLDTAQSVVTAEPLAPVETIAPAEAVETAEAVVPEARSARRTRRSAPQSEAAPAVAAEVVAAPVAAEAALDTVEAAEPTVPTRRRATRSGPPKPVVAVDTIVAARKPARRPVRKAKPETESFQTVESAAAAAAQTSQSQPSRRRSR
ncbi:DEAD/DEAH box helicase [Streptomyces sp. H27-D2]|uniref:DEAD/DEAH box helicase n=1 Tax=Streptomyces sp. H27-D2 TaxID=3046304 RepID=UPI002DBD8B25|nr:DEAD/DEAH box helicase [Streptomyces sp. H27-D2]MEC4019262.1 DEAD/DEAH box helicase [Streptomyces sp. H27-D2]